MGKEFKWEYLAKMSPEIERQMMQYVKKFPVGDDGRKQSYNKVINKALVELFKREL